MGNIKSKVGKCLDCGPDSPDVPVMAGRCYLNKPFHYQKHKEKIYKERQARKKKVKSKGFGELTLPKWFNEQINQMPSACENCGEYLSRFAPWGARAYIAHIVPKRFFESVMVHPDNRLFLCIDCHSKFDNSLSTEIKQMKVYPLAVDRFKSFMMLIYPSEIKYLQPFLEEVFFCKK